MFSQLFERELNLITVFDGDCLLQNTFSGGQYQIVDIDSDDYQDIFNLDSD
jgi:hypothetical protein